MNTRIFLFIALFICAGISNIEAQNNYVQINEITISENATKIHSYSDNNGQINEVNLTEKNKENLRVENYITGKITVIKSPIEKESPAQQSPNTGVAATGTILMIAFIAIRRK